MKAIIAIILAAASLTAHAGNYGTVNNDAGGKIVFTDDDCAATNRAYGLAAKYVWSYAGSGAIVQTGCASYDADLQMIHIYWNSGGAAVIPLNRILLTPYGRKILAN